MNYFEVNYFVEFALIEHNYKNMDIHVEFHVFKYFMGMPQGLCDMF